MASRPSPRSRSEPPPIAAPSDDDRRPELGVVPPRGPSTRQRLERLVLLGPDLVCRAAATQASAPEERWMLAQPHAVRVSYVHSVLDREGDVELLSQVWIMRQPRAVRESYIREILTPALQGS